MPVPPPIISSQNTQSTTSSHAPVGSYHHASASDPTPAVGTLMRLRPQTRVSKLVNQFMNMSQMRSRNTGGAEGLPGFLYHVPELPRGHSCKSMVDMYHAMTEWANENPGPGKRPNLRAPTSSGDKSADRVSYPECPESYDVYHQKTGATVPVDNPYGAHSHGPPAPKESLPLPSTPTAVHNSRMTVARKRELVRCDTELVSFSDARCGDKTAQEHGHKVHPDLSLLRPLYPETANYVSSSAKDSDNQGKLSKVKRSAAPDEDRSFSTTELRHHKTAKKNLQVPKRASSRPLVDKKHPDKCLEVGLPPAAQGEKTEIDVATDSKLPVKLRIAHFEANAQAMKRRPVHKSSDHNFSNEISVGQEAVPDIIRCLTPHNPVGPPLSKKQMAELCEPRAPPQYAPRYQYKPYRPEYACDRGSMNDRQYMREKQPQLRHVESITFDSISQHDAGRHPKIPATRLSNLPMLVPKVSHSPVKSVVKVPNLPSLAISTAFGKDEALQKLQHYTGLEERTDCEKTQPLAPKLTHKITISPPSPLLPQNAQLRLHETLYLQNAPQSQADANTHNSFRRSLSRGTAARLLEVEPGFDFNAAFQDARKSRIDPALRQTTAAEIQKAKHFDSHHDTRLEDPEHDTILLPSHNATNNAKRMVREKVELFEAKARESIIIEDVTCNLGGNFAWPRFSDRQYVDPASEYSAKWREERKARRQGRIFDPKEVEKALQADAKTNV